MVAAYPSALKAFTTHTNLTETVDASHVNALQDEVASIESTLGTSPAISTTPNSGGTFTATSTVYSTVSARLANIETGVVADSHSQYIRKNADSANTITPTAAGNKGLVIKANASQTANLMEWQNSSGTAVTYIDSTGALKGFSVSGNITIGSTTIALGGSTSALVGVTLTTPTINNPTINSATLTYTINSQTVTTYAATASDGYSLVTLTNAAAISFSVPANILGVGAQLNLIQFGAGQVTVSGGTGVTILSTGATPSTPKTRAQYSVITLVQASSNSWVAMGDLV